MPLWIRGQVAGLMWNSLPMLRDTGHNTISFGYSLKTFFSRYSAYSALGGLAIMRYMMTFYLLGRLVGYKRLQG